MTLLPLSNNGLQVLSILYVNHDIYPKFCVFNNINTNNIYAQCIAGENRWNNNINEKRKKKKHKEEEKIGDLSSWERKVIVNVIPVEGELDLEQHSFQDGNRMGTKVLQHVRKAKASRESGGEVKL